MALTFIDGVPEAIVPDQPRTAIRSSAATQPAPSSPAHYGTSILPARPRKAKVETGVLIAQRDRNRVFYC